MKMFGSLKLMNLKEANGRHHLFKMRNSPFFQSAFRGMKVKCTGCGAIFEVSEVLESVTDSAGASIETPPHKRPIAGSLSLVGFCIASGIGVLSTLNIVFHSEGMATIGQ
ncbi:MAG: hypothetical protein JWM16_1721 [Verrucomicrobiales bacterium]|nr:hypothetical protein [Verrucomicrobiales bacterium]